MTETIGVAIGIGVLALVFIYLGCLMWKKEKITKKRLTIAPCYDTIVNCITIACFRMGLVKMQYFC